MKRGRRSFAKQARVDDVEKRPTTNTAVARMPDNAARPSRFWTTAKAAATTAGIVSTVDWKAMLHHL